MKPFGGLKSCVGGLQAAALQPCEGRCVLSSCSQRLIRVDSATAGAAAQGVTFNGPAAGLGEDSGSCVLPSGRCTGQPRPTTTQKVAAQLE